jgi:hypothetical protein
MLSLKTVFSLIIFLIFIGWTVDSLNAADQDFFDIYNLEIEGEIYGYLTGEFDDDDLTDIAIIYSPADDINTRYIALYIQKELTGFNKRADYLTELPAMAAMVNATDINDDGRAEILFIDSDGIRYFGFKPGVGFAAPTRLIRYETVFAFPLFHGIITNRFVFDITDSPGPEIILPAPRGYAVFERGEDGNYQILNQLSVAITCRNRARSVGDFSARRSSDMTVSFASISVLDGNLDGHNDIYFLWDRKLCCFFQDSTGNFSQAPDMSITFFPSYTNGYFESQLVDYNNDRRPDVVVSCTSGGISNSETKVRFHVADANGRISAAYIREISLSDSHCNMMVSDYDGDNIPELVIPAIELGSMAATKILLMKKADLNILIYPIRSGMPVMEPEKRRNYEFRINLDDAQPTDEVAVDWSADYNGDRYKDLVFSSGKDELKFYWGEQKEYLSKKADLEIPMDHPSEIFPIRLNHGRYSDVIIKHNLGGRTDRLTVLRNKNNKL